MGYLLTDKVWRSALPSRLKPIASLVAHLVLDENQDDREACRLFASVSFIASCLNVHPNNARRQIRALEAAGILQRVERGGGRRRFGRRLAGRRTLYVFRDDRLPLQKVDDEARAIDQPEKEGVAE
jgi:Mn-dependent DtxR family transcriptional regulator